LGDWVVGRTFADLFAGTGSYGLEAWSRGARGGVFVERHRATAGVLAENVQAVARSARLAPELVRVVCADALSGWEQESAGAPIDLFFVDPPYPEIGRVWNPVFAKVANLVSGGGYVVFELPADLHPTAPAGWEQVRRLNAGGGQPTASLWRRSATTAG
jgi:16S rRNA (guanine966-N2)-methyltransferase